MELRKTNRGRRPCSPIGKTTLSGAIARASGKSSVVEDPRHAGKQHAREPGDLAVACVGAMCFDAGVSVRVLTGAALSFGDSHRTESPKLESVTSSPIGALRHYDNDCVSSSMICLPTIPLYPTVAACATGCSEPVENANNSPLRKRSEEFTWQPHQARVVPRVQAQSMR